MRNSMRFMGLVCIGCIAWVCVGCADDVSEAETSESAVITQEEEAVQAESPALASKASPAAAHTSRSRGSIEEEMDETGFILEALKGEIATEEKKRAGFEKKLSKPGYPDSLQALDRRLKLLQSDVDKEVKRIQRLQQELSRVK